MRGPIKGEFGNKPPRYAIFSYYTNLFSFYFHRGKFYNHEM